MIKIIFIFFIIVNSSFSSQIAISTKIVNKIISAVNNDAKIWIYSENEYNNIINISKLNTVSYCQEANVLIVKDQSKLPISCQNIPIIVFDYDLLYSNKNSVAAFFWKKGRPNIIFIKQRLDKFDVVIPNKYKSYLVDKL